MQTEPQRVERRNHKGFEEGRYYRVGDKLFPSSTTILSAINKPALPAWAAKVEREAVLETIKECLLEPFGTGDDFLSLVQDRLPKVKAHKRLTDQAAEIGTEAHSHCEWFLKRWIAKDAYGAPPPGWDEQNPEPQIKDEALWAAMSFQDWTRSVDLQPIAAEECVWSELREYAGTLDFAGIATIKGKRRYIVGDIKTGKAIYDEARLQVASYIRAYAGIFRAYAGIYDGLIVRLPKLIGDPAFEVAPIIEQPELDELLETFDHVHQLWRWMDRRDQMKKKHKAEVGHVVAVPASAQA